MPDTIRIAGIIRESIVDGKGLRFVVFGQGCPHHCPGCHNPQTHDFAGGKSVPIAKLVEEIQKNPLLQGVTFSGGEPFAQIDAFTALARKIRELPQKLDITVYSGYTWEQLQKLPHADQLLQLCDYLIDGPFLLDQRDISLKFRGSRNQRYLDLKRTRRFGIPIPVQENTVPARKRYQSPSIA
ncbi:MAG: anaerobic ribonucleoside-triphosphate reductase activating protein [Candidatus Merdivicinus sp.]|jgi:anaerobic ribonucleoside-triphosphate reductase activating protein